MKTIGYSEHPLGFVDIDNDAYHAGPGVSKSHLDLIRRKSPKHYWHRYLNQEREPEEKTVPMIVGQATHFAILQPDLFELRVVKGLEHARRSNAEKQAWSEFEAANKGNYIVSADMYDRIRYIRDAVWSEPECAGLLAGIIPEQSVYGLMDIPTLEGDELVTDENGVVMQGLVKCQFDGIAPDFSYALDLKSTEDASEEGFARSMANYRYDVQDSWYEMVSEAAFNRHPEEFIFLCYEKEPPYVSGIYWCSKTDRMLASQAARRDFAKIEHHRRLGVWPQYSATPRTISLPGWYRR